MKWKVHQPAPSCAAHLSSELGLCALSAQVLAARGFTTPAAAHGFIHPALERDWGAPGQIAGIEQIALRLVDALQNGRRICVFGDFDVDGITASTLVVSALEELGCVAQPVLPLRVGEGYGLTEQVLERIFALEPEVLLTVDCGVSAAHEVALLQARGIEVLVTDHHESSQTMPAHTLLADPKLEPLSAAAVLSGAGVALKLVQQLGEYCGKPQLWRAYIDLATLGTIADRMPLTGENRALVAEGVRLLNAARRPGIAALLECSNRANEPLTAESLSFGVIPRLNAAGRISDPMIAFDLLRARDRATALRLAARLEALNEERRMLESQLLDAAHAHLATTQPLEHVVVVGGEGWHDGVKGIVASRLAKEAGVPAIVFSFEDGIAIGSGRSVGEVDLHEALESLSDMLLRFGGHRAAVGLALEAERLPEFSRRLEEHLAAEPPELFHPAFEVDTEIGYGALSLEAVEELAVFEPHGKDNPEPCFFTKNLLVRNARYVGTGQKHVALELSDGIITFAAIWFNAALSSLSEIPQEVNLVYHAQVDEWRGRRKIKLRVLALEPCEPPATGDNQLAQSIAGWELTLKPAQQKCLDELARGHATLGIMATGRGKSLIFQTHAIKLAQAAKAAGRAVDAGAGAANDASSSAGTGTRTGTRTGASLFIYPLRSLINDQEHFLAGALGRLGIGCASLTGATPAPERERTAQRLAAGELSVILSTPEFVFANSNKMPLWRHFDFVVIDEAHHIASSNEEYRPDYTRLERLRALMPQAVFCGFTATSDTDTTNKIVESLAITHIVVDTSKRPNLLLSDQRGNANRDSALVQLVENSPKCIVYAGTRARTIELCKLLRKELRSKGERIAFYNAALTTADRRAVEEAFRGNELDCIIATSAFGEGVNIPHVRDVVLYDTPYSIIDFTQMAGRAGRDGAPATVHLFAQRSDAEQLGAHLARREEELACADPSDPSHAAELHEGREHPQPSEGAEQEESQQETAAERAATLQLYKQFTDWLFCASADEVLSVIQHPLTPLGGQQTTDTVQ